MSHGERKLIIITGASSGIGRELALILAAQGHGLILAARRESLLNEVADGCLKAGARSAIPCVCDVASESDVLSLARTFADAKDSAFAESVLVNNAGAAVFGPYHEQPWSATVEQVVSGLTGSMLVTQAILPDMLASARGLVVFVGSIATRHTFAFAEAYTATKYGLLGFARSLSESYRREGLRVTTVTAGATDTPLWAEPHPPRDQMLPARSVAEAIAGVIALPADRTVDELVVTPLRGVL